jgi:multicomponent Na+:H+ antiporter subunit F
MALDLALVLLGLAFVVSAVRVALGPSLADRVVASDVCLLCVVATLAILSVRQGVRQFEDAVLVAALFAFVATVSLARLIERGSRR